MWVIERSIHRVATVFVVWYVRPHCKCDHVQRIPGNEEQGRFWPWFISHIESLSKDPWQLSGVGYKSSGNIPVQLRFQNSFTIMYEFAMPTLRSTVMSLIKDVSDPWQLSGVGYKSSGNIPVQLRFQNSYLGNQRSYPKSESTKRFLGYQTPSGKALAFFNFRSLALTVWKI